MSPSLIELKIVECFLSQITNFVVLMWLDSTTKKNSEP